MLAQGEAPSFPRFSARGEQEPRLYGTRPACAPAPSPAKLTAWRLQTNSAWS